MTIHALNTNHLFNLQKSVIHALIKNHLIDCHTKNNKNL